MNGKHWKWIHFGLIIFFLGLWAVAALTGWVTSVTFVSHVSMLALVLAEIAAWQAAHGEEKNEETKSE